MLSIGWGSGGREGKKLLYGDLMVEFWFPHPLCEHQNTTHKLAIYLSHLFNLFFPLNACILKKNTIHSHMYTQTLYA